MKKLAAAFTILLLTLLPAKAEYIEAPNYPAGQWQINDSIGFLHGEEDGVVDSLEVTYGINDWLAAVAALNTSGGEKEDYNYYGGGDFTLQFNVAKETGLLPSTALRLTYSLNSDNDEPDTISTMAVFEKKIGNIDNFLNIAVGKTVNGDEVGGAEFGVAAQSMYGLNNYTDNDEWAVGVEYFGDFGKTGQLQGFPGKFQQAGPIISYQPLEHLQTSLNYLVGLTDDAPRSAVTFEVNVTF